MASKWAGSGATTPSNDSQIFEDIEKGLKPTHAENLASPISPIHEGITPSSSLPILSQTLSPVYHIEDKNPLPEPAVQTITPARPREKISRWVLFRLWFSTYRKFFTVIVLLNSTGITLAALGHFPYAENHLGALVLGNLLFAVLMRNELFLRFLYLICIYGLRSATWCFTILGNVYDIKRGEWRADAHSLLSAQELWFAVFMTVFIAIPWVTLREVPVEVEIPSPKVAILKFERGMQQGLLGRISRTSIMEYHAFGIISEGRKSGCHYMICGVQGDFTKGLVADPPKTVWTRELKFAGVGHASAMFKRGIRICTGTGIGAALSTCIQSPDWFFIWIGSDQEKTFGPTITGLIHKHIEPDRMILWDSKKRGGRPDTVQLLRAVYTSFRAEVIFITSNKQGNDEMMQGCLATGMNAFGTLWDF
ncbi:hypothetical protein ACHAQH_009370 [Verticillium albo-atrum]